MFVGGLNAPHANNTTFGGVMAKITGMNSVVSKTVHM
jgi:hypothetical protein